MIKFIEAINTITNKKNKKRGFPSSLFSYIKILVSEQGNAVCEKLLNCHNLLIMRNDKKDY